MDINGVAESNEAYFGNRAKTGICNVLYYENVLAHKTPERWIRENELAREFMRMPCDHTLLSAALSTGKGNDQADNERTLEIRTT